MLFALVAVPLIAATGSAIDYSIAYQKRTVVQDALDAAALAANRLIGIANDATIRAEAQAFFTANIAGNVDPDPGFTMVIDGGSVRLTSHLSVPTSFLSILGLNHIDFDLTSLSTAGAATYEVALVLDNSGSMQGSKLSTLKTAALELINSLFSLSVSNPKPNPVMIGLVPFAASVNIGAGYATASWMDRNGISPVAAQNFQTTTANGNATAYTNTFALFSALHNASWRGCVEARPSPYDVTDATPAAGVPATLFEPMFAPDEPGTAGNPLNGFTNSYLADTGGTCSATEQVWVSNCNGLSGQTKKTCQAAGGHYVTQTISLDNTQLQERTCKYQGVSLSSQYTGAGAGPNLSCTSNALTPLTASSGTLVSAVNSMAANGNTNIEEGVMWGWRLLSPTLPFDQGRAYDEAGNHKVMIVMTDGANTYNSSTNINRSEYAAYEYVKWGQLGTTSTSNNTVVAAMNARTLTACANARAAGITIYTIAFQVQDASARQILNDCASDPSKAFESNNNADLLAAFRLIAQDITQLRIAE